MGCIVIRLEVVGFIKADMAVKCAVFVGVIERRVQAILKAPRVPSFTS